MGWTPATAARRMASISLGALLVEVFVKRLQKRSENPSLATLVLGNIYMAASHLLTSKSPPAHELYIYIYIC